MRRFIARLRSFLFRGRAERELAREVASHLAMLEDDYRRRGMTAEQARWAARRAWGGVDLAMERHRDERSFVALEQLLQDARHAARSLRKSPAFVAVALVSLALGIGANTAIYTLVHGILLKQLPVADPHRVVQIQAEIGREFKSSAFSFPAFRALRAQTGIFADVIGFGGTRAAIEQEGRRRPVSLEMVTGSYFSFLDGRPTLGRLLDDEDDRVEGARPVCVISHDLWQSLYGGDRAIVGRRIRIGVAPVEVVGVAAPEFAGASLQRRTDVWVPTSLRLPLAGITRETPNWIWIRALARLQPGVSLGEASARLAAASPAIEASLPKDRGNANAVYRLQDASTGFDSWRTQLHDPLLALMGAVGLVLLVACANLANLLLARASERRQEFAIKLSLGVSRGRLLRQLLLESLAVTFAGGVAGLAVGAVLTRQLLALFNAGSRFEALNVAPDGAVLLYTFFACAATALAAGLYPAWQASRTDPASRLASTALQGRRAAVRRALILAQVTLAVVLLFGASLFTHSLRNLKLTPLGMDIDRVLTVGIESADPGAKTKPAAGALIDALSRVRETPGVEAAAMSQPGPLSGMMMTTSAATPGVKAQVETHLMAVTGGYLSTLRVPLLRGRDLGAGDRPGAPRAVLVNDRLASVLWPGADPVGRPIVLGDDTHATVVGVVGNSHYRDVREETLPIAYTAFDQGPVDFAMLEIRSRRPAADLEREVRRIVKASVPAYTAGEAAPLSLLRDAVIAQDRLLAFLSSIFGALGTALALVGIYGLISYAVTRRTREVGIRLSVGAQRRDVLWLFARETVVLLAAGMALGVPLAIVLAKFIGKMLYNVSTGEPRDLAIALVVLAAGGLAASYIPGRRATRIDPVRALRYD